jgi:hypothetical protein
MQAARHARGPRRERAHGLRHHGRSAAAPRHRHPSAAGCIGGHHAAAPAGTQRRNDAKAPIAVDARSCGMPRDAMVRQLLDVPGRVGAAAEPGPDLSQPGNAVLGGRRCGPVRLLGAATASDRGAHGGARPHGLHVRIQLGRAALAQLRALGFDCAGWNRSRRNAGRRPWPTWCSARTHSCARWRRCMPAVTLRRIS